MIVESALAIVAAVVAVGTWTTYGLWHNDKDVWLLSNIGRGVSYIWFPGEADLFDVASEHRAGPNSDPTHHAPCILCSKTEVVDPSGAVTPLTWSAPPPNQHITCTDPDNDAPWYGGGIIQKAGYWLSDCEDNRPARTGEVSYNFELTKDCYAVRGVGGMPVKVGMKPTEYIWKRMFPKAKDIKSITMNDINGELFQTKQPYLTYHSTEYGSGYYVITQENASTYTGTFPIFNIPGYYIPLADNDVITVHKKRPFMPPMINCREWLPLKKASNNFLISTIPEECKNEYVCPAQLSFWTGNYNNIPLLAKEYNEIWSCFFTNNEDIRRGETLQQYLDRIKFTAYQVINYNGRKYYTFEYAPNYEPGVAYDGKTDHPNFIPVQQWNEIMAGKYVKNFLESRYYRYVSLQGQIKTKRIWDERGFMRL